MLDRNCVRGIHYEGIDESASSPRNPGWPPEDWCLLEVDPFDLTSQVQKKGLVKSSHWISPHAAYESLHRMHAKPEEKISVHAPKGKVELSKEELLGLAMFPSEIVCTDWGGPWYSSLAVFPATEHSVREALQSIFEGGKVPKDLAIQFLKHCCGDDTGFQIQGDGVSAEYTRNDLYALLCSSSREGLWGVRDGDRIIFLQSLNKYSDAEIMELGKDWQAMRKEICPQTEACKKAQRWPSDTVEILTKDGPVEITKDDLLRYASDPTDVWLFGNRWATFREDGLPAMDTVVEQLRQIENGERVSSRLAIDYAKLTGNFDVIMGFMNAGTKIMLGIKLASPNHPEDPFIEYMINPDYIR